MSQVDNSIDAFSRRKATASLEADRQTGWQKHDANRRQDLTESDAQAQRQERLDAQRRAWTRQDVTPTRGGTRPDSRVLAAQNKMIAARSAAARSVELPSGSVLQSVITTYLDSPQGRTLFRSRTNLINLVNCTIRALIDGAAFEVELVAACHEWLLANGYIEFESPEEAYDSATGGIVRKRGTTAASHAAPRVFEPYVHPSHEINQRIEAMQSEMSKWAAECEGHQKKDFTTLEAEYKKSLRVRKATDPEYGAI